MEYLVRCHCGYNYAAADMLDALMKGDMHRLSERARLINFCEPHIVQAHVSAGAI